MYADSIAGSAPDVHMKAIVYSNYGSPDVLRCEEIEKPTAGDDEVLIKVRAASVNPLDWHLMRGTPYIVRIKTGLPWHTLRLPDSAAMRCVTTSNVPVITSRSQGRYDALQFR